MDTLKVVSHNIHKGKSAMGTRRTVPLLIKSLNQLQADIIFLQEIQGRNDKEKALDNQPQKLAEALGMQMVYGCNCVRTSTDHGNALLTRLPIISHENQDISDHRLEQRGVLHVRLALKADAHQADPTDKVLHCFVVHLGLFKRSRQRQVDTIVERISRLTPLDDPVIIAGDFNDWNDKLEPRFVNALHLEEVFSSEVIHKKHSLPNVKFSLRRARAEMNQIAPPGSKRFSFKRYGRLAQPKSITRLLKAFSLQKANLQPRTFPVRFPWLRLDRMYQRGFIVEKAQVLKGKPWIQISDHAPICAEIHPLGKT